MSASAFDRYRPETRLVHAGTVRSQFGETSEAMFLTQGYVYDSAAQAERRAQDARLYEARFRAVVFLSGRGHAALLWPTKQNPAGRKNPRAGLTRPRPFSNLFYVAASRPAQMTTG